MERDDAAVLRELLQFIYSSHWGRYRGLVAVVSRRLDVPAEHLETEIAEWLRENHESVQKEAFDRMNAYFAKRARDLLEESGP